MDLLRNRILPIAGGLALVGAAALFIASTRNKADPEPERDWEAEINAKNARIVELDTHTTELDAHIAEQDTQLVEQKKYIAAQSKTLAERNKKVAEQDKELGELRAQLARIGGKPATKAAAAEADMAAAPVTPQ